MKNILLVDDEKVVIDSLLTALQDVYPKHNFFTANDGREALRFIESRPVDLVVTDLKMPVMDGFELLSHLNSEYPSIPVVIMSAFSDTDTLNKTKPFAPITFLNKPFKLKALAVAMEEGLERARTPQGDIAGISLINFIQLVSMEQKTCLLEVGAGGQRVGYMYFNKGVLFDAVQGDLKGEEAVQYMLSMDKVDVSFKDLPKRKIHRRIERNALAMIMEAVDKRERRKHEDGRGMGSVSGGQAEEGGAAEESMTSEREDPSAKVGGNKNEIHINKKEKGMNVQKLNEAVESLKEDLGDGLLATDLFGAADGQSVAGYNTQPKACALFNELTKYLTDALQTSGFPGLGRYYLLDLVDGNMVVVIPLGDYRWGMLLDGKKTAMGLLINIVIPKIIDAFEDALTG